MGIVVNAYMGALVVGTSLSVVLGLLSVKYWDRSSEVKWFTGLVVSLGIWSGSQFFQTYLADPGASLFWAKVIYIGVVGQMFFMLVFILEYTEYEHLINRTTLALLSIEPLAVVLLSWTNGVHHLFWADVTPDPAAVSGLAFTNGPLLWIHTIYSYVLLMGATVLLFRMFFRSRSLYRGQVAILLVAMTVPWAVNVLYFSGLLPVDLTSAGFVVTGTGFWLSMYRFDFIDISPVARNTVVDNMQEGMFVLDEDDKFIDINETGRKMLGIEDRTVVGERAGDVLVHLPELYERYSGMDSGTDEFSYDTGEKVRHYQIEVSPITNKKDDVVGRLFVFRDVTERKKRQQELERQNEQLEQFASLVSHDLRNPLNVAGGYVEMIESQADEPISDYAEEVEISHDRMRRIIEDVLTMAREGQTIEETEPVELRDVAEDAWRNVDTKAATLENSLNVVVDADRSRVIQVFENLFRNAIDHGRDDVTIRVGNLGTNRTGGVVDPTENGFFVEDDGPGIPENDLDTVFEAGHTTHEEGTGLGLSIVEQFVEAHGWGIAATNAEDGGARFEVTGVTPVDRDGTRAWSAGADREKRESEPTTAAN